MTLDCNRYRINVPVIAKILEDKTEEERYNLIGELAIITGVPIIVLATYVGELYGFSSKLEDFIERLKKFYAIDEVLNRKVV